MAETEEKEIYTRGVGVLVAGWLGFTPFLVLVMYLFVHVVLHP